MEQVNQRRLFELMIGQSRLGADQPAEKGLAVNRRTTDRTKISNGVLTSRDRQPALDVRLLGIYAGKR